MRVVVEKDYEAMSRCATDLVQKAIEKDPQCLVSFPGGWDAEGVREPRQQRND